MLEEYARVSGAKGHIRLQQELVDQAWDKSEGEDGVWTLKVSGQGCAGWVDGWMDGWMDGCMCVWDGKGRYLLTYLHTYR